VIRVAAVDEWASRKGTKFGMIVVDLERRRVVDLLADRVAARMADWFKQHPEVEIINRDRDGLYAEAARQGAPQARQVADRFHLLKNLRETIARQLEGFEAPIRESATEVEDGQDTPEQPPIDRSDRCSETAERERLRRRRRAARQAMFDEIRALFNAGSTVGEIAQKLGLPLAIPTTLHGSLLARLHRLAHTRSTLYRGDRLTRLNLQIFEEWTSSNACRALLPVSGSTLASCLSSSSPISRSTYRSASAVRGRCRARQRGRLRRSALRNTLSTPLPMSPPP
jgi:hypothetical protein